MVAQVALVVKILPANAGDLRDAGSNPCYQQDPLEEEVATHSSILVWRIPWIEEPILYLHRGGYVQFTGGHKELDTT